MGIAMPLAVRRLAALCALALALSVFCLPGTAHASEVNGPIGRGEAMDRSWSWIAERVPYSMDSNSPHTNKFGTYRRDCSGYVSMAWHLDRSRTTWSLWDVTHEIPASDLQPADALLRDSGGVDHVALFVRWADAAHTQPVVREEYDYGHVAEERVWSNGLRGFTPVRYDSIDDLVPYGTIGAKYASLGGQGSLLGLPTTGERDASLGGRFQVFQNGMIIWHPDVAYAVHGDILAKFWATDAERAWGFPVMDESQGGTAQNGTTGRYQKFENALFLWSPVTGTHIVHGAIRQSFEANGNERKLGYPTSDEIPSGDGGRYQTFQNAVIHWHPDQGTWITR
ncbi:hypothetical protein [Streptomyces sp. NPDC059176]|uniref:hypothetical protein n=1 Tax=unclassified Streptomyces TaxID=2593676 RepID=UPI00368DA0F3